MIKKITIVSGFVLLIDQIIKHMVSNYLTSLVIIPKFLSLIYAQNTGVAFSLLSGKRIFIIIISIILIGILIDMLKKEKTKNNIVMLSYGLLFGGILGNLIDRIVSGAVIDYISLKIFGYYFPIFNLADVAITIGVILLVLKFIKIDKK